MCLSLARGGVPKQKPFLVDSVLDHELAARVLARQCYLQAHPMLQLLVLKE
jgi:hypothetical protein